MFVNCQLPHSLALKLDVYSSTEMVPKSIQDTYVAGDQNLFLLLSQSVLLVDENPFDNL